MDCSSRALLRPDLRKEMTERPTLLGCYTSRYRSVSSPLPDETLIGGAHFSDAAEPAADGTYTAPIGDLVTEMDALTMDKEAFVELVLSDMPPRPANYEDIIATNLGKNPVDDDEAFTLELGPNNCAASQDSLAGD